MARFIEQLTSFAPISELNAGSRHSENNAGWLHDAGRC